MKKKLKKAETAAIIKLLVGKTVKCIIFNSELSSPDFALHGGFSVKLIEITPKRESLEFRKGNLKDGVTVHLDLHDIIGIVSSIDDAYLSLITKIGKVDFVIEKQEEKSAPALKKISAKKTGGSSEKPTSRNGKKYEKKNQTGKRAVKI